MPVDQIVPSLCDPFGAHEQRHPAADASSEADENLGQLFEIAKGQIRYRPRESGETFEISDVTLPDVGDEAARLSSSHISPRPAAAGSSTRPLIGMAPSNAGTIQSESSVK
jgi:hypothetical protein